MRHSADGTALHKCTEGRTCFWPGVGANPSGAIDFALLPEATDPVNADVAQLVARNLAKVQVAGSTPVVRSIRKVEMVSDLVEWPRGEARDCKSRYTGSNPVSTSNYLKMVFTIEYGRLAQR